MFVLFLFLFLFFSYTQLFVCLYLSQTCLYTEYYMSKSVSHAVSTREPYITPRATGPRGDIGRGLIRHVIPILTCNVHYILSSFPPAIFTCWLHKQNSYQSSRELSWTYQQWAGVITKFYQHLNDNSCEDDKSK
jgi:hypothetical protein